MIKEYDFQTFPTNISWFCEILLVFHEEKYKFVIRDIHKFVFDKHNEQIHVMIILSNNAAHKI